MVWEKKRNDTNGMGAQMTSQGQEKGWVGGWVLGKGGLRNSEGPGKPAWIKCKVGKVGEFVMLLSGSLKP